MEFAGAPDVACGPGEAVGVQPRVEVVRVVNGLHDALGGGVEDAGERLVDTGGLEDLDDVVVVGAAVPDGVGEQVERPGRGRGEHGQVLTAGKCRRSAQPTSRHC
ncbi:hypothetical protein ACH4L5_08230 [Streptomyces sp. NPDC017405]